MCDIVSPQTPFLWLYNIDIVVRCRYTTPAIPTILRLLYNRIVVILKIFVKLSFITSVDVKIGDDRVKTVTALLQSAIVACQFLEFFPIGCDILYKKEFFEIL